MLAATAANNRDLDYALTDDQATLSIWCDCRFNPGTAIPRRV